MYKIILITFVLGYTVCDDTNINFEEHFRNLSNLLLNEKITLLGTYPSLLRPTLRIVHKTYGGTFDYQGFLKEIKEDIVKYSKKLKNKNLNQKAQIAETNRFVDRVINQLKTAILSDVEPIQLADLVETFGYKVVFFNATGELKLTHGILTQISSLNRQGDVEIRKRRNIHVTIPLQINELAFAFDYAAKMLGIGPSGKLVGTVTDFKANLQLIINIRKKAITKVELAITNRGKISFQLKGGLVSSALNLLKSVVSTVLDRVLLFLYDDFIDTQMGVIIKNVNDLIQDIVNIE